ncbi:unnamed protein product [Amaranthus hypochondriacus]
MIEIEFYRLSRNESEDKKQSHSFSVFRDKGKPLGKLNVEELSYNEWKMTQLYILTNCDEVKPFIDQYENEKGDSIIDLCN